MGGEGDIAGRLELREGKRRFGRFGRVGEDHRLELRAGQGVFDVELIIGIEGDAFEARGFQELDERGAQAVILASGISDAVYKNLRDRHISVPGPRPEPGPGRRPEM